MKQSFLIILLLSGVLVATVTALIPKTRPGSLGTIPDSMIPGSPMEDANPLLANSFDSGSDYRPLDFGYLPGTTRYMGNRIKGSGYTSLHGLNYESVGYRDDYYTNEAYPQLVGQGQVRVNGQDAELTCQFPPTFDIISNIVWEKLERNGVDSWALDRQDPRFSIRQQSMAGSRLVIGEYSARDEGVYRCIATRRDNTHFRQTRTVYQDIPFVLVK
ncbi:hypothetical protein OUZ56_030801 [Daphnia magna]|uniref:Ig-like domain-containing protein n=1 Tax=Daphnia magna TaxID=35525 RepID=A0ABQ9ZSC8_9CRUS|nr:hypothetical protein OUZ56_030801 [Daphnia magna]